MCPLLCVQSSSRCLAAGSLSSFPAPAGGAPLTPATMAASEPRGSQELALKDTAAARIEGGEEVSNVEEALPTDNIEEK